MKERRRRVVIACAVLLLTALLTGARQQVDIIDESPQVLSESSGQRALDALGELEVKGRAAKTGYDRAEYGDGWLRIDGCDTRNRILLRDLENTSVDENCKVLSGTLEDPYTGNTIGFVRGASTSAAVQVDHVVALSDAWQKGASYWDRSKRIQFANDPLELLAVDGQANQDKGGSDAASWLPPHKAFRCQYVARQIAIKQSYDLWVTSAEKASMQRELDRCPEQRLPNSVPVSYTSTQ